ncbi:hypothetical protein ACNKHM_25025 [Shigella sonnei]
MKSTTAQLAKLDTTKGVLLSRPNWRWQTVSMLPAALSSPKKHYEVIAGVNIPMLVET